MLLKTSLTFTVVRCGTVPHVQTLFNRAAGEAAAPFLRYADGHPQAKRIRVGVAVNDPASKTQPFETPDEAALGALMAAAEPLLRRHSSFAGFAVFASWWYASSLAKPAPPSSTS